MFQPIFHSGHLRLVKPGVEHSVLSRERKCVDHCFGSLVILDVARCYLWLFTLYINIKISKNSC